METKKISDSEYAIYVYDWDDTLDDYLCGNARRDPNGPEGSDLLFWRFYPSGCDTPINAGDLKCIALFLVELNRDIKTVSLNREVV